MIPAFLYFFSIEREDIMAQIVKQAIGVKQVSGSILRKFPSSKNVLDANGHTLDPALSIVTPNLTVQCSALHKSILSTLSMDSKVHRSLLPAPHSPLISLGAPEAELNPEPLQLPGQFPQPSDIARKRKKQKKSGEPSCTPMNLSISFQERS